MRNSLKTPLEEYLRKQRGAGGADDNPSVEQFGHSMLGLHVSQCCVEASRRGNKFYVLIFYFMKRNVFTRLLVQMFLP